MKVLTLIHGIWIGGAQISILEFLELLRYNAEFKIITCINSRDDLISRLNTQGLEVYQVPCRVVMGYPLMVLSDADKLIEWADIVWITDVEYLAASHIKKMKSVPIVSHLHNYHLICPQWTALYGLHKVCLNKCSYWRITRCKQAINMNLARIGLINNTRAYTYWLLDLVKGPLDYRKWSKLLDNVVNSIDGFIPVSKALWNVYVSHIPELEEKSFEIIHNMVTEPLRYVKPDPNEPYKNYVLYASGPGFAKGAYIILEAWSNVSKEFNYLKLYMIRCKDTWVERLAKKLRVKNIVFLGRLPPEQHYNTIYESRAVVVPSLFPDPLSRIPIEANRLGVPAITTNRGGFPEVIEDNVTGIISGANSEELANAIVRAIKRKWSRSSIIERISTQLKPDELANKLLGFFEEFV
ncbi:MAG: hypothetical protein B6U76_00735 [Desulfurococcales archaeon ex4484_217_2]|nr:MAG: hypothetical protein B6U76_00735 [Desulfurococcales archaeon ex4484_217_2]